MFIHSALVDCNVVVLLSAGAQPASAGSSNYMDLDMPMEGNQKTMMWQQQNQYVGDSGIQSGATTQAPSVSSKHGIDDDMDTAHPPPPPQDTSQMIPGFDFDPGFNQGFTQEQVSFVTDQTFSFTFYCNF